MKIHISDTKQALGAKAAADGAELIRQAISARGTANIIVATGASQFEMLGSLIKAEGIAWHKVTAFHLDEYIGMPITHPASFRQYLWRRFVSQLSFPPKEFYYINAEGDAATECARLNGIISRHPIDVAFVGIGENAHLAFNDPPADFKTDKPYVMVDLDEACRKQQFGEGWFKTMDDVPRRAVSMSCPQIMKAATIIAAVPDSRKAKAVQKVVEGPVTPDVPSSLLQRHAQATIYLDRDSASLLKR